MNKYFKKSLTKFQRLASMCWETIIEVKYKLQLIDNRRARTVHFNAAGTVTSIDGLNGLEEQRAVETLNAELRGESTLSDEQPY